MKKKTYNVTPKPKKMGRPKKRDWDLKKLRTLKMSDKEYDILLRISARVFGEVNASAMIRKLIRDYYRNRY